MRQDYLGKENIILQSPVMGGLGYCVGAGKAEFKMRPGT